MRHGASPPDWSTGLAGRPSTKAQAGRATGFDAEHTRGIGASLVGLPDEALIAANGWASTGGWRRRRIAGLQTLAS